MPKVTITNIPNDMTHEVLDAKIFDKDAILNIEINSDDTFSMIKLETSKTYT